MPEAVPNPETITLTHWLSHGSGGSVSDLSQWCGIAEDQLAPAWLRCQEHMGDNDGLRRLEEMDIVHIPDTLAVLAPFVSGARDCDGRWSIDRSLVLFAYSDQNNRIDHDPNSVTGCDFFFAEHLTNKTIISACTACGMSISQTEPGVAHVSIVLNDKCLDTYYGLLDVLFGELLTYSRPLARYHATFYLELDYGYSHERERAKTDNRSNVLHTAQHRSYKSNPERTDNTDRLDLPIDSPQWVDEGEVYKQAELYYRRRVRQFLFDGTALGGAPGPQHGIDEWSAPGILASRWRLITKTGSDEKIEASVIGIRYIATRRHNTALLAIDVEPAPPKWNYAGSNAKAALQELTQLDWNGDRGAKSDQGWWLQLVFGEPRIFEWAKTRQYSRWLRFTCDARTLYVSFSEQWKEDKIYAQYLEGGAPASFHDGPGGTQSEILGKRSPVDTERPELTDVRSQIIDELAKTILKAPGGNPFETASVRHDSRMFTNVSYALCGPKIVGKRLERITADAGFVNPPSNNYPANEGYTYYAPTAKRCMEKWSFDWWNHEGALYTYNDYCNAYVGSSNIFRNIIAPKHVTLYERSLIYGLSLRSILNQFVHRMADVSDSLARTSRSATGGPARQGIRAGTEFWVKEFRDLHRDFIDFTGNYWFLDMSAQWQGQEIVRLQQSGLNLQAIYDEIQDELQRLHEHAEAEYEQKIQRRTERIGWVATLLTGIAVVPLMRDVISSLWPEPEAVWGGQPGIWAIAFLVGVAVFLWLKRYVDR